MPRQALNRNSQIRVGLPQRRHDQAVTEDNVYETQRWAVGVVDWYRQIGALCDLLKWYHGPAIEHPPVFKEIALPPIPLGRMEVGHNVTDCWIRIQRTDLLSRQNRYFVPAFVNCLQRGNLGVCQTECIEFGRSFETAHHLCDHLLVEGMTWNVQLSRIACDKEHPGVSTHTSLEKCAEWLLSGDNKEAFLELANEYRSLQWGELRAAVLRESHNAATWLQSRTESCAVTATPAQKSGGRSKPTVNARMFDLITRRPESREWTAREFAEHLSCAVSMIAKTAAWRELQRTHAMSCLERRDRGRASRE